MSGAGQGDWGGCLGKAACRSSKTKGPAAAAAADSPCCLLALNSSIWHLG
jgi:hypothetical protein